MVIDKILIDVPICNNEVFMYIKSCDLISIREGKNSKSIWFKDNDNNFTMFTHNLINATSTVLATIRGIQYNSPITNAEFNKLFLQYKIFKI
jgi:hypothetical protein